MGIVLNNLFIYRQLPLEEIIFWVEQVSKRKFTIRMSFINIAMSDNIGELVPNSLSNRY